MYLLLLSVGVVELLRFSKEGGNSVTFAVNELLLTSHLLRSLEPVSVVCTVALLILELDKISGKL